MNREQQRIKDWMHTHPRLGEGIGTEDMPCSIAAINLALYGELDDSTPSCASSLLCAWVIRVQDSMSATIRDSDAWRDLLPYIAGTRDGKDIRRLYVLIDWLWRLAVPKLAAVAGMAGLAVVFKDMLDTRSQAALARMLDALSKAKRETLDMDAFYKLECAHNALTKLEQLSSVWRLTGGGSCGLRYSRTDSSHVARGDAHKVWYVAAQCLGASDATPCGKGSSWVSLDPCGTLKRLIEAEPAP